MQVRLALISLISVAMAALAPLSAAAQDEPACGAILIADVRVLDFSGSGPVETAGRDVLVRGGRIVAVRATGELTAPPDTTVIAGRGRFLMPGLVDMHVHVWDEAELGAYLAHGVTTVRNASGMPFHLRLAEAVATGRVPGPRLITTGPILNSQGANTQLNHQIVETADDARAAVRAQHAAGFRRIKVYSNLRREAYTAIKAEAERLGMTLMGHTPEGVRRPGMPRTRPFDIPFRELLDDGFVSFEHMESIVWHGLRERRDEDGVRRLAERIAASGTAVDPTLLAFRNLLHVAETRGAYLHRPGVETLNPLVVAQEQANYERWSHEAVAPNRDAFAFYQRATRIFAEAGVLLVAGSDAGIFSNIPGLSLIEEIDLLIEAGLAPSDALRAATYTPAVVLQDAERGGRIAPGRRADMILLAENPLNDVRAITRADAVIAGGRRYDRAALERLQQAARAPDVERTRRNLVEGLRWQGIDPAPLLGGS